MLSNKVIKKLYCLIRWDRPPLILTKMNKTKKMSAEAIQNFLNLCEVNVVFNALNGAQQHIVEKFVAYCKPRGITIKEVPAPHKVSIFASTVRKKTNHIACPAILNGKQGWVVNMDSARESKRHKTLKFFSTEEAACAVEKGAYDSKVTKPIKERTVCAVAPVEAHEPTTEAFMPALTERPFQTIAGVTGFVNK